MTDKWSMQYAYSPVINPRQRFVIGYAVKWYVTDALVTLVSQNRVGMVDAIWAETFALYSGGFHWVDKPNIKRKTVVQEYVDELKNR